MGSRDSSVTRSPGTSRFEYKTCFIVDVDGKKLPNKLDLWAFRRGKKVTSNEESKEAEESDEEEEEESDEEEEEEEGAMNSNNSSSTSSTGEILTYDDVSKESLGSNKLDMDEICNKLGAKRFVGFMCKRFVDSKTYHYGKLLLSGLVEDDDGTFGVNNWLGKMYPSWKAPRASR